MSRWERSLEGRVALVTGGAVRLGRAIALGLAGRGASVAFTYHGSETEAHDTLGALRKASRARPPVAVQCDVTSEEQVRDAFRTVDAELGRPDLLVNNAAIFEETPFEELTLEAWQRHLDVNLTGPMLCSREAGRRMREAGEGVIVNIACASAERPWPRHLAYGVSKAGLLMLTKSLARALAPEVRVNAVAPGPVLLPENYDEQQRARAIRRTALHRAGSPDDVVRAVLFCWDSDYTTGALVPVEGGRLLL